MTVLLLYAAVIILSHSMAKKRGRDTSLAVVGAILFGFFTPLYYLIVGDSPEKKTRTVATAENE